MGPTVVVGQCRRRPIGSRADRRLGSHTQACSAGLPDRPVAIAWLDGTVITMDRLMSTD